MFAFTSFSFVVPKGSRPGFRVLFLALLGGVLLLPAGAFATEAASAPAPLRLTLGQAVGLALDRNPTLRQSANQVAAGEINLHQRQADFAPDLRLALTGDKHFDKEYQGVSGESASRDFETASGAIASTVNLFNGFGDLAAWRGAGEELAGLRDSFSRDEQTLIFTTVSQFLEVLTSRELIAVRRDNLEGNRRQLEQVEALYRAGNRPVSDLYQQQAEMGGAELDLLLAERDEVVAKLQLLQTIGLSPTGRVELVVAELDPVEATLLTVTPEPPGTDALTLRPDLSARHKQIEAAREQVKVAAAGYWPSLDLAASVSSDYSSLQRAGFNDQFFDDNAGARVGLALSVPVFDRQVTRNNVAQSRLRLHDAELELTRLTLQADAEYGQAVEDFQTAQKLIGVTTARLAAAREALAAMEERYRVGAATLVELTQARTQFTAAAFERVKARFGLLRQRVALAYYRGDGGTLRSLLSRLETR